MPIHCVTSKLPVTSSHTKPSHRCPCPLKASIRSRVSTCIWGSLLRKEYECITDAIRRFQRIFCSTVAGLIPFLVNHCFVQICLSLARSVFCHCCAKNIPWPLRKQRESSAYLYFIRLLCMAKQLLWCSRKIEMLKTEEKTGILLSGIQIKSEITLLDMDTLTHKYRPFVRQNGTHNCSNWLLRVFLWCVSFVLEISANGENWKQLQVHIIQMVKRAQSKRCVCEQQQKLDFILLVSR